MGFALGIAIKGVVALYLFSILMSFLTGLFGGKLPPDNPKK
jgi:hypothetical protein